MMVLTKRVGDSPESHIPSLEVRADQCCSINEPRTMSYSLMLQTAVRRIQTAIESGEWTSFCASFSSSNPHLPPEKTATARSTAHQSHGASTHQASVTKEVKASAGLGAGMAAAAELEETKASAVPASSLPHSRFSPRGVESPKSVGFVSFCIAQQSRMCNCCVLQVGLSLNTVTEHLTEELDTVPRPERTLPHSGLIPFLGIDSSSESG
jgi:hypothetical protein